ncbi:unnamed protein product [Hymenolepis diminuta]|uniref:Uncharacterized protein n=1 Tax=Hymenolepis diminuta TaxID=6216 RepID=A0A564Y3H1_HYMDI|nr:unnamed protein product [Hymenolepis diminuta]
MKILHLTVALMILIEFGLTYTMNEGNSRDKNVVFTIDSDDRNASADWKSRNYYKLEKEGNEEKDVSNSIEELSTIKREKPDELKMDKTRYVAIQSVPFDESYYDTADDEFPIEVDVPDMFDIAPCKDATPTTSGES